MNSIAANNRRLNRQKPNRAQRPNVGNSWRNSIMIKAQQFQAASMNTQGDFIVTLMDCGTMVFEQADEICIDLGDLFDDGAE